MQNPGGLVAAAAGSVLQDPSLTLSFSMPQEAVGVMVQHQQPSLATSLSPQHLHTSNSGVKIEEAHSTTSISMVQQLTSDDPAHSSLMENDKKAIYRHPLFPLMALLFEKCEQATQTPDCPTADSFDVDIQAFVRHQEQDRKPFFSDDPDLDGLMVKAIQVLRIHLLELEKVNELCKDFCARYTSCLKGKLQSENLLSVEGSPGLSPGSDPDSTAPELGGGSGGSSTPSLGPGQVVSGGTVYQMVQTPHGLVAQPVPANPVSSSSGVIQGSTPLSQIGLPSSPHVSNLPVDSSLFGNSPDFDDDDFNGRKSKRGVLPKQATQVMKSWLFQHIVHPYPTEDEKRQIATQTNLTLLQVNNWFINARRRILQPMLDASNPEGSKAKKSKPVSRPPQRFWPGSIAGSLGQGTASQASSPSSTTPDGDQVSENDAKFDDEGDADDDGDDDDDDDIELPTPQQIVLPPGVTVTADGQIVQSTSTNLLGIPTAPSSMLQCNPSASSGLPAISQYLNSSKHLSDMSQT